MSGNSLMDQLDNLPKEKKAMINRLRRVEGQLRGIQRMIIEDKPCYDTMLQLSAARKAMQKTCILILKNSIIECLEENREPDVESMEKLISALIDIAPTGTFDEE